MKMTNEWAIVLAAGDGTRLSVLTDREGVAVPKQYWSLRGGRSLLGDALHRAYQLVTRERTLVVVAEKHRALWEAELAHHPAENVVVQPENRGTAAGILLPLLTVLSRDPEARIAVLPSDHFIANEIALNASLRLALSSLGRDEERLVLLGITPQTPETGYGWIVPESNRGSLERVSAFVEKPPVRRAQALLDTGSLWNSFLFAARGARLLARFQARQPALVAALSAALARRDPNAIAETYARLESVDFSRELLQGNEQSLWVLRVPECGWTDLGTPERVVECLAASPERVAPPARFSLAAALSRARLAPELSAGLSFA